MDRMNMEFASLVAQLSSKGLTSIEGVFQCLSGSSFTFTWAYSPNLWLFCDLSSKTFASTAAPWLSLCCSFQPEAFIAGGNNR
eukprot:983011-Pelagomonas_calceolata.AAC.1